MDGHDRRVDAEDRARPDGSDAHVRGSPTGASAPDLPESGSHPGITGDPNQESAQAAPDDGLIDEIARLFDDGVTYGQAELAFQKTRARLAGRAVGIAALCVTVALILVHIALLALAVGLVMALAPLVTIWGAIAIVVGVILLGAVWLLAKARSKASKISALFSSETEA